MLIVIQLWQNAEKQPTDMMINSLKFAENIKLQTMLLSQEVQLAQETST